MPTYQKTKQKSNHSSRKQSSPPKRSASLSIGTPALAHERTPVAPSLLTRSEVLHLQRTIGNQAVTRLLMRQDDVPSSLRQAQGTALALQAKLKVNAPDDEYEQEANRVADEVMSQPEGGVADRISDQDIQYEVIAHKMGYEDTISGEASHLLTRWGYVGNWVARINDESTGFFVGLLMPDEQHPNLRPLLVFRGTEPSDLGDIASDLHPVSVGDNQFKANQNFVAQLINEAGGEVDVMGHSLGGALAQHTAAAFPDRVNRVVTFQAPAITTRQAEGFSKQEKRPSATHHIAGGDLVDTAGGEHLEGEFYRHTPGGGATSHMKYLLTAPEFKARREAFGIDDEMLAKLEIKAEENKSLIERYEEYPHQVKNFIDETIRSEAGLRLYPLLSGINALTRDDDSKIRQMVEREGAHKIAQRPISERSYMIHRLTRGVTLNADENTILTILEASRLADDVVEVADLADVWRISHATDGKQYDVLREFLNKHYYAQTSPEMALQLIQQCMDGETAEWEEEMIADILIERPDGRDIITRIGQIYAKGGFDEGLNQLEWQLDGRDQSGIQELYGKSE